MFWERKDAVLCYGTDIQVVGSVFPWGGFWAAALQNETMKTARTEQQARAFVEKYAETHYRKILADDFASEGVEFVPNRRLLNYADRQKNTENFNNRDRL